MDLNAIKQRLNDFNTQNEKRSGNSNGEKKNYFFRPTVGKETVRVVPSKTNPSYPFTEMKFYYGIGDIKVMASPANWGDKCPIEEFVKQLRQTSDSENWRLAKKLDPKVRTFAPIIVRGQEDEGVKLWQFGSMVYQDFLNMADDGEVGDYTDIVEGRDIKLTTVGPEVTGTSYNKTTVAPSMKVTTLSNDEAVVKNLLEEQPDPMSIFKRYSYEEIKTNLAKFLSPEDETEGEIISEAPQPFDTDAKSSTPSANYSLDTSKSKQSKTDKFDDLFSDDSESDDNDLPF
jgi:hypothetical protein